MMTLDASAVTYNEWFESLKRAGFTEDQALYIVGQGVAATQMIAAMRMPNA